MRTIIKHRRKCVAHPTPEQREFLEEQKIKRAKLFKELENKHKKPNHAKNAAYWFEQCAIENEKRGVLEFEMQELDEIILELRESLSACVDALDQEALASNWFKLPLYRCGAWYQIRAEAHRILNEIA